MNDYVEVKSLIIIAIKRWWLIIGLAVIGVAGGYLISRGQTPIYEATTTILVGEIFESTELDRTDILTSQLVATTYAEMVRRRPVLEGVVESLNLTQSWRQLKDQVKVILIEGTQLIQITVEDSSPSRAQMLVNEIANQVISISPTRTQIQDTANTRLFVQQQIENFQARLETGQSKRDSLEIELVSTNSTERLEEIQREIDILDGLISGWESNYTQLLVFLGNRQSPNNLTIVEPALASNSQISPNTQLFILIGFGVGFLLALGATFTIEFLDESVKSADDLQLGINSMVLGKVPKIKGFDYDLKLREIQDHMSSVAEDFRLIGGNLHLYSLDGNSKSLMITSPNRSEGKSLIISSLGIVLANTGIATIIVDANPRRPAIHEIFNLTNKKGLMDLLSREKYDIGEYLHKTEHDSLKLLPIGNVEINPSSLLIHEKVNTLIDALKVQADVVLFDSSSVLDHADSKFLSTQIDGVILVVAAKRTRTNQIIKSIQNIEQAEAILSGIIFNEYLPGKPSQILMKFRSALKDRFSRESIKKETILSGRTLRENEL